MNILKVDHITINLLKVKESIKFYENVIGLTKDKEVDMGDHKLHLYKLADGTDLELIEYLEEQRVIHANNTDMGIYRHFALLVDDINEVYQRCVKANYGINSAPNYIEKLKMQSMLIMDPNGVEVEFLQK